MSKIIRLWGPVFRTCCLQRTPLGLGLSGWERYSRMQEIRVLLELPPQMELMAVVAIGHPIVKKRTSQRREIKEVLIKEL